MNHVHEDISYHHAFTAAIKFDPDFIRRQLQGWRLRSSSEAAQNFASQNLASQSKATPYDQFFAQINNDQRSDQPSHMCGIRSNYEVIKVGASFHYLGEIMIVTGKMKDSEILRSIIDAKHAYLHIPGKPYFAECFLEEADHAE